MTTYTYSDAGSASYSNGVGNAFNADGTVSTPSTFTTTDKARVLRIPGGTRLTHLTIRNTDLDSGATITAKIGYEKVNSGGSLTDDDDYFTATNTLLRTAGTTVLAFDPVTFTEDVWITVIPDAGPATTAGTITAIATGRVVGMA